MFGRRGVRSVGGARVTIAETAAPLKRTPLHPLHVALGAKMVPFAGYEMPVQYPTGVLQEHLHTRAQAGLFDVSHMGQVRLAGADAARALEALVPSDLLALAPRHMRYTLLLNEEGGILDDLMATRLEDALFLVVNAACKEADLAHLRDRIAGAATIEPLADKALLALQGPAAATVLSRFAPTVARLGFMTATEAMLDGRKCLIARSGYTGEDGYEISLPAGNATTVAEMLLAEPEVWPIGLGARDSLRLEAGLCLYGHDIDETTTPVEAGLGWTIGRRRRVEGGFSGAAIVLRQLAEGAPRRRIGIRPDGRAPAREDTPVIGPAGETIGRVTSGGFGPSADGPIAMGYVDRRHAAEGTPLTLLIRGLARPARAVRLPFVPHRYHRG
jgi:aminomethyltransferase